MTPDPSNRAAASNDPDADISGFSDAVSSDASGHDNTPSGDNTPAGDTTQIGSRTVSRILVISDVAPAASDSALPDAALPDDAELPDATFEEPISSNGIHANVHAGDINGVSFSTAQSAASQVGPTDSQSAATPLQFVNILIDAGHVVSVIARRDWELGLSLTPDDDRAPELIIIDAGPEAGNINHLVDFCRHLKSDSAPFGASIVAALPPLRQADHTRVAIMSPAIPLLLEAGVDDLFTIDATEAEILARVASLVRMARLRTELDATREYLRLHLQTDETTHLLNRRFFFQAAHREYGRARRYNHELSCLMVSVDFFKHYNAMYGYDCGDYLLRTIANILRDSTRDSDIVARFSEDKFIVMLPETPIDGAIILRENVQRAITENSFNWHATDLPVSVSIGEAARRSDTARLLPEADEDDEVTALSLREELAELLEEADSALYVAKRGVRSPFSGPRTKINTAKTTMSTRPARDFDSFDDLPALND